jgi:uncharacterized membrane protein
MFRLPADLDFWRFAALALIFLMWTSYGPILRMLGRGTLNEQLHSVRVKWMRMSLNSKRESRVFDGILLGQISSAMSFFGSATLIVLAGLVGTLASINRVYAALNELPFFPPISLGLFTLYFATLTLIMAASFFAFTYAMRKLAYTLAMIGALNEAPAHDPESQEMIAQTATVLTQAVRSMNTGIRGFYYAVSTLFLFVSPMVSITMTLFMSFILYYRQGLSTEALAIERYVDAMNRHEHSRSSLARTESET